MPSSREWRLKIPMRVSPAYLQLELGPENYPCQRSLRGSSGNVSREAHVGKIILLVKKEMGRRKLPSFAFGCDCDVLVLNHEAWLAFN